jgi:long-chain acyl-CoA synthetase
VECDSCLLAVGIASHTAQIKAVVSGGAPLAPHVEDFLRVVMCAPVVQGYGLTETCAASFIASADKIVSPFLLLA